MGKLEKRIAGNLKESIKTKKALSTSTLRMINASIHNTAIEKQVKELEDGDVIKIISKQAKQRLDSIESFKKGDRADLVEKETKELEILRSYLPEQLDERKIEEIVKGIISETGAASKSEFGKVMKLSMEQVKGKADGKIVSSVVQKLLK